jgi:DNA-binding GntR family transcriptional regulator
VKDSEFHIKLAEISGNPYLFEIIQKLDVKVQLLRTIIYSSEEEIKKGPAHHLPLVEAIRKKNKREARRLIKTHLENFYFPE